MKRLVRPALGAAVLLALAAAPVLANHTHVKLLGNGQCVVLAENGGEDDVVLPQSVFDRNPNVVVSSAAPPTRSTCSCTGASRRPGLVRRLRIRRGQRHVRGRLRQPLTLVSGDAAGHDWPARRRTCISTTQPLGTDHGHDRDPSRRTRPTATRLLGVLGVLGGLALLAAFVVEIPPAWNTVRLFLFPAGAIAVAAAAYGTHAAASRRPRAGRHRSPGRRERLR